jgi:hypothetical protein
MPTEKHRAQAREKSVDVGVEADKFRAHAEANDRRQVDWNASFRLWLSNARPGAPVAVVDRRIPNEPLEAPPDGLDDHELAAWYARRRA